MIRAGELRKRVTFQARSTVQDSFGDQPTTWSDVTTVWASLEPAVGRELMAAQAMAIDQPITITVRWRAEFADPKAVAAMRAIYNGRIFNISSCDNQDERNRVLVMLASEGLNNG